MSDTPTVTLPEVTAEAPAPPVFQPSAPPSPVTYPRSANQQNVSVDQSDQWLRKIELLVYESDNDKGSALNLTPDPQTQLQVVWQVRKATIQSPDILFARIFNLAPSTVAKVVAFKRVQLSAGYRTGRYGVTFNGTVVQFRRGKENPTDTYLEIIAQDGWWAAAGDTVTGKWETGTKMVQIIKDQLGQMKGSSQQPVSVGDVVAGSYGDQQLLRRMVTCRMGHMAIRDHCNAANADWFVEDGKHVFLDRTKYRDGEAAVLRPSTGMVGIPEVTPQGIQVKCLFNPNLKLGGLVKIDTDVLSGVPFTPGGATKIDANGNPIASPPPAGVTFLGLQQLTTAFTSPTGTYKILLLDHNGETRGNPWYSDMVCVALDAAGKSIPSVGLPYGRTTVTDLPTVDPAAIPKPPGT